MLLRGIHFLKSKFSSRGYRLELLTVFRRAVRPKLLDPLFLQSRGSFVIWGGSVAVTHICPNASDGMVRMKMVNIVLMRRLYHKTYLQANLADADIRWRERL